MQIDVKKLSKEQIPKHIELQKSYTGKQARNKTLDNRQETRRSDIADTKK